MGWDSLRPGGAFVSPFTAERTQALFLDCMAGIEAAALKQASLKDHDIPEEF